MRTTRIFQFLALLAVLAMLGQSANAKIIKKADPRDGSIKAGDTIAFDLNRFFDFQLANMT